MVQAVSHSTDAPEEKTESHEGGFSILEEAEAGHILYGDTGLTV